MFLSLWRAELEEPPSRRSGLPPTSANYTPALNSKQRKRAAAFPISPSHHPHPTPTPTNSKSGCVFQPTLCPLQFFSGPPSCAGLIGAEPRQHTWERWKHWKQGLLLTQVAPRPGLPATLSFSGTLVCFLGVSLKWLGWPGG